MRLVDADKLIEKGYWHGERPDCGNPFAEGVDAVDTIDIENAPTVDAVPVVHGQWVTEDWTTYCSVCHESAAGYNMFICDGEKWVPMWNFNYCPNCGAKMDGGN